MHAHEYERIREPVWVYACVRVVFCLGLDTAAGQVWPVRVSRLRGSEHHSLKSPVGTNAAWNVHLNDIPQMCIHTVEDMRRLIL